MTTLTLCPACGERVQDLTLHIETTHSDILKVVDGRYTQLPIRQIKSIKIETPVEVVRSTTVGSAYNCDQCGNPMDVIDSRKLNDYIIRRKQCHVCHARFTTYEIRLS